MDVSTDPTDLLAAAGYTLSLASLIALAGLPGVAGAAILAGLWVLLSPAGLLAAITVATAALTPDPIPILAGAFLGIGTATFLLATTARRHAIPDAVLGTTAIAVILAVAALGGWIWTTTLWGVALTIAVTATVIGYVLHRYTIALTAPPQ